MGRGGDEAGARANSHEVTPERVEWGADEVVAARYDERDQAIERVATDGRGVSRARARTVQGLVDRARRGEHLDKGEVRKALGDDGAYAALKTALKNELKKIRKSS